MRIIKLLFGAALMGFSLNSIAQENVVEIIDDLRAQWDLEASNLKTFDGVLKYCRTKGYRDQTVQLLTTIHHYDSVLYSIVKTKYANTDDDEVKSTLEAIIVLESEYDTKAFLNFLRRECTAINDLQRNKAFMDDDEWSEEISIFEKDLVKYVLAITNQIDMVDEHVHHLKGL